MRDINDLPVLEIAAKVVEHTDYLVAIDALLNGDERVMAKLARALLHASAECERMRGAIDGIRHDFDRAIAAHDPSDPRHRSHGGQHTNGRCCAFGNLNPGALRTMRQWRDIIDDTINRARAAESGE